MPDKPDDSKPNPTELTPPDLSATLTPPEVVQPVTQTQGRIKLSGEATSNLDAKVQGFVDKILNADAPSEDFKTKVEAVHRLGNEEIRRASSVSNRMLERPLNTLKQDSQSKVSQTLLELRKTVETLDPGKQNGLGKRLFGLLPARKAQGYFQKYQSSQAQLNTILDALYSGQDELRKDNATIEQEKVNLWDTMERLEQYVYIAQKLDEGLESRITQIEQSSPEKARIVREEMLFYLRQKVQDLQTQLAVSIQGYLALDMVRKNNLELVKGVDRATTTTLSALRTAVMVSQGLANQKLVLDQVNALNTTTGNMIESTSELLKTQSAQVHTQASSAVVGVEQLQAAFDNVYTAMDTLANYKLEALANMKQTVTTLSGELERSKNYLDRVRNEELGDALGEMKGTIEEELEI